MSAGPYGYSFKFLKKCWRIIKDDVILFVRDSHYKARLTKACTTSFLALIPKVQNPKNLSV